MQSRHVASDELGETASQMAAWAIQVISKIWKLQPTDLDLIIFAGAAFEQPGSRRFGFNSADRPFKIRYSLFFRTCYLLGILTSWI